MMEEKNLAPWQVLSGSTLKLIAIITMLIDHFGASILAYVLINFGELHSYADSVWEFFTGRACTWDELYSVYNVMRGIGRVAFPIFCFLLVEGYIYTRNRGKYVIRMFIFALISEVPFDMAVFQQYFYFDYQNVYWTLALGLLSIWTIDVLSSKVGESVKYRKLLLCAIRIGAFIVFAGLAKLLETDYDIYGVIIITALYITRMSERNIAHITRAEIRESRSSSKDYIREAFIGAILFLWELPAPLGMLTIPFYNGKRGLNIKYLFYVFYPLHLFILGWMCMHM